MKKRALAVFVAVSALFAFSMPAASADSPICVKKPPTKVCLKL